ncbi:hypothetical protein LCGC14_0736420 [marine sediment metagenome]|uniref:Uncharacterized protein n=1 Tax=marine sediment metagenome TaxID=412755 RepID=A0A0F9QC81_9ZZZZ
MSKWDDWQAEHIDENGRHREYLEWRGVGGWELERSDGIQTCHKFDGPFSFWSTTAEESMRIVDKFVPLGGDPPEGVTDYSGLWELDRLASEVRP